MVLVTPVKSYTLSYIDCLSPNRVQTFDASKICSPLPDNDEISEDISYTIMQQPTTRKVTGFSCSVRRSIYYYKCGVWAHLKVAAVPKVSHPMDLTPTQCRTMATTRNYYYPGNPKPFQLQLNKEIYLEMVTTGELVERENHLSCTGEDVHIGGTLHRDVLILEELRFLIETKEYLVSDEEIEVRDDHVKLPCKYQTLGCTTGQATYIWTQFPNRCKLEIIQTIRPSRTMGTYFVDHSTQFLINTTGTVNLPSCPMTLTRTDHPSIFLAPTSEVISLPTVEPTTVDVNLQSHINLNYMAYALEREMDRQDRNTISSACKANHLQESSQPIQLKDDRYGTRRGDVYYSFTCKTKTATILETTNCWTDIPIENGHFVNPVTKQLLFQSTKIPCSKTFPMVVKSDQGWIELYPHIKSRPAPIAKPPQDNLPTFHHTDYSHGGIYSETELKEWQHTLSFPVFHEATLKAITYGSCVQTGNCPTTSDDDDIQRYDLTHLIPTIEHDLNLLARFKAFLKTNGDLMAFLCLTIIGIKLLSDIILISITTLRAGPAAAAALITSLYLYNRSTYQRILRRHRQRTRGPDDPSEQVPLQQQPTAPLVSKM